MKYLYCVILFFCLTPVLSKAQSNYKPGYVVTLKGDTLYGFINYKDWDKTPKTIGFKTSLQAERTEYTTKDISAFTLTGYEKYRRFNLWISQDNVEQRKWVQWQDTTKKFDTVFLRMVTTGKNLTLYAYKDKIKPRYFVSEQGGNPVELEYHIYIDTVYTTITHESNIYKIQLQKLTAIYKPQDQKLIDEIQLNTYNEDALSDIAYKINGSPQSQKAVLYRNAPVFFAGISGSGISSSFKVGSDQIATINNQSKFAPGLDVGADIYTNKDVGRWIFRLELSAAPNSVNIGYITTDGTASTTYYDLKFKQLGFTFTPQLIYNLYNTDKFKFYLDAGIGLNGNIFSAKQYTATTIYTVSGTGGTSNIQMPALQFLAFDVPVKAGVIINKNIDIYAGFNPKMRLDDDIDYQVNQTSFIAGIHYFFNK